MADSCDITDETSTDCNDNGQLDSCDIAEGSSVDCFGENGLPDGVPDECCPGDMGAGEGHVGPFDLAGLLANWGVCPDSCIEGVSHLRLPRRLRPQLHRQRLRPRLPPRPLGPVRVKRRSRA